MNYKTMKIDDIINWCKENNQVDWLKATAAKTFTKEDGKERKITFIEIKNAFCAEFMPELLPKKKNNKPTMYELIASL